MRIERARALVYAVAGAAVAALAAGTARGDLADGFGGRLGPPQPLGNVERLHPFGALTAAASPARLDQPHPAVVRVVVPEGEATSYGSGTLVDVRDQFGLVVTNWHVVRDHRGEVEVHFPDGFHSKARPLKVDADWDLAALIIWRPPAPPVKVAVRAPSPGDQLTICGYGSGQYRAVTGRCTQYYSPAIDLPQHMVELDVEARQGDSGGPIFNEHCELAGVLFGAGQGTTLGSFGGRVGSFLADLAPDIGRAADYALVQSAAPPPAAAEPVAAVGPAAAPAPHPEAVRDADKAVASTVASDLPPKAPPAESPDVGAATDGSQWQVVTMRAAPGDRVESTPVVGDWTAHAKNLLAAVGAIHLVMLAVRAAR